MKIAHIVCVFPPYGGGIGTTCYQQVKSLADQGHEVTVFTPKYKTQNENQENHDNFKVKRLKPVFSFGNAGILLSLFKNLKNFDLVQLHHPFIGSSLIVFLWKIFKGKKTKLVVFYHMDLVGSGAKGFIFKLYTRIITPLILRIADKVFVSSYDYMENSDASRYYQKNKSKFQARSFTVDTQRFFPQQKDLKILNKLNIPPESKNVLFVGGLDKAHYFKGLPLLLRAWQKLNLNNTKLIIVGSGELADFYKNLSRDLGIEKSVIFAGYIEDKLLPKYYNLADVFVLPSVDKSEAFGMVTLEAQACAKPAIVADLPGVRQVIKNQETGFTFELNNLDGLTAKLKKILENDSLRLTMAERSRQRIENQFDANKIKFNYE